MAVGGVPLTTSDARVHGWSLARNGSSARIHSSQNASAFSGVRPSSTSRAMPRLRASARSDWTNTTSSAPAARPDRPAPTPSTIIEQAHADLKNSALAHLPSGKFTANAAWLVLAVMAFNLTRVAATLADTSMAKATTATIRRKLVHVPARIASSARRLTLHLPRTWPWEKAWTTLFTGLCAPPPAVATT